MMKGSGNSLENMPPTSKDESGAYLPMPLEVREAVIDILAQILVADYKLFQGVTGPTVKTPPAFNRKLKLVKTGEKAT